MQQKRYNCAKTRLDMIKENIEEILEVQHQLIKAPIMGYKYNYSLDSNV